MPRPAAPAASDRDRRRPTPARARRGCGSGSFRKGSNRPGSCWIRSIACSTAAQRQPRRAEDPQQPLPPHRLDDLDRPDPVGHRPRHARIAQPVIGPEARVAQVFQPAGRHDRRPTRRRRWNPTSRSRHLRRPRACPTRSTIAKRLADPRQRALQALGGVEATTTSVAPHSGGQSA